MKLIAEKQIALRCSLCGKLNHHTISPFSFSGKKTVHIHCECGFRQAILGTRDYKQFWLQVPCVVCETEHIFPYPSAEFWTTDLTEFYCPETDLGLGFLGNAAEVSRAAAEWEESETSGFDGYFDSPGIMYEIVDLLHHIAEKDGLYCQCGNHQIEVELYPERLELHCQQCHSCSIIYAETEEDLKVMRDVQFIEMAEHGFACIDASNFRSIRRHKH